MTSTPLNAKYVLISAVRNEQDYINGLASCVIAQQTRPTVWVIVDDGSSDRTVEIATTLAEKHPWIRVEKMPVGGERSFSSQVYAAKHGYATLRDLDFDFVGFLDADIRFDATYYDKLVRMLCLDSTLGLVGGAVVDQYEKKTTYLRRGSEDYHVPGGVQLFRREAFDRIGGYQIIDGGGQDTIADIMVQMRGWRIRVNPDAVATHLRPDGVNAGNSFRRGMRWGRKFYLLGYHPLYFLAQNARRWKEAPFLVGAFFQLVGFVVASFRRERRPVSAEFVAFLRALQMRRLKERVFRRAPSEPIQTV